jgi:MFS family permease
VTPTTTTVFGATFARNKGYGIGFHADVHLWIPILGNILAVLLIPYVGSLSDRHGRRPCLIFGALTSGIMSFGYLWAVSQQNVALAIFFSLAMWGAAYQGYNAVFPTFYPEPFPTKTRVTGMAVSKNIANLLLDDALMYVVIVPPGSTNVVLVVAVSPSQRPAWQRPPEWPRRSRGLSMSVAAKRPST